MSNHPNRGAFPYRVGLAEQKPIAGFPDLASANQYARWASLQHPYAQGHGLQIDVNHGGVIVASFVQGRLVS